MSTIGLVSDYRTNRTKPEWYTAERYDFCEQIDRKASAKKTGKFNPLHFLLTHVF